MISAAFYRSVDALGVTAAARRLQRGSIVLCYHNVVTNAEPVHGLGNSLHMPLREFERQVRWLSRRYSIITLRELVGRIERGEEVRGLAALTFDDGYAGVIEHALPLLNALGIPATIFVIAVAPGRLEPFWWDHPDLVRREFSEDPRLLHDLRGDEEAIRRYAGLRSGSYAPAGVRAAEWRALAEAAANGVEIGVHSAHHRALPRLNNEELQQELTLSCATIARETGHTPEFFAYPYGLYDDRVAAAVRLTGYRAAFTLRPSANQSGADRWQLGRINIPAGISQAAFSAWTAGLNPRSAVA